MLANYESSVPPNYPDVTDITNYIYIENIVSVEETSMMFSVTLDLISTWLEPALAYNSTNKDSLDLTSAMDRIWKPQIQITDNVKDEGKLSIFTNKPNRYSY